MHMFCCLPIPAVKVQCTVDIAWFQDHITPPTPYKYRIFIHSLVPSPKFSPFSAHHLLTFV
jgi:hypothetical protein